MVRASRLLTFLALVPACGSVEARHSELDDGGAADADGASVDEANHDVATADLADTSLGGERGAPSIVATTPVGGATEVAPNQKVTIVFSAAMDPATVNATTFTLEQGTTATAGVVSSVGNMATFAPSDDLAAGVTFTATITTGAKGSDGQPLAGDHVWTFTTSACRQTPVALGAAANFAVLAGPTVTNTGITSVIGDVGVSPGTTVTGFPAGAIVGFQHAGDPTAAQAMADLKTAFDDAAGRTRCPIPLAGNLGGKTLLPGLYASTTSLEISAGDLTLDARGDADAIFVFQMTTTLITTTDRRVVLAGGARSANVYWQVGSSATLGSSSAFEGTLMAAQSITVSSGATVHGRVLARIAAVSVDASTIVKPAP
jgi:hypothetical protein